MSDVAGTPEPAGKASATVAAWAVLVGTGGTSIIFNVWHATHVGHMLVPLALLYGITPVFVAMCLSHIVATHRSGWMLQAVTFAVMLGAMSLSIGAIGEVVGATAGHLRWLYGGVLDTAALVALRVILAEQGRRAAAEATARAAAEAAEQAIRKATAEATARAEAEARASAAREAIASAAGEPGAMPAPAPPPASRKAIVKASGDPEAEAARSAYRKSKRTGSPLTDRALGELYGRSRTWGASRIREVEGGPKLAEANG